MLEIDFLFLMRGAHRVTQRCIEDNIMVEFACTYLGGVLGGDENTGKDHDTKYVGPQVGLPRDERKEKQL